MDTKNGTTEKLANGKVNGKALLPINPVEPRIKGGTKKVQAKKAPAPSKTTKKAESKKDKPKVNDWGHRLGSQSAQIDEIVKRRVAKHLPIDIPSIMKESGLSHGRIYAHLDHLKNEKKLIKDFSNGKEAKAK